ncbi:hypothetical protein FP828_08020 [bacterium]|nr:hypothetical protein [bacterium]
MSDEKNTKLPETVDEAVSQILDGMSADDKKSLKNTQKKDLIKFHFGWGMGIRNGFGLWNPDSPLLKSMGEVHPDDASGVIIEAVWKKLQEK